MKALVYAAHDRIEVRDVPEPAPGAGEVLVRVAAAGICGSELEAFATRSPRRPPPLVMGHEFCGQVAALGPGVQGIQVGDRVVMNSLIACGACEACREGRAHLCPRRDVFGMRRPGGFAELCVVPAATVFHLPEKVSPLEGALVEPLANAVHVGTLVQERLPETVVVIDAAGTTETRRDAVGIARPGGEVVWIGLHGDETALSGAEVVLGERRVQGSYAVTARDLRKAIGLFAHGRVDITPWARPFPLTDGGRVFRELLSQPKEYVKAILLP